LDVVVFEDCLSEFWIYMFASRFWRGVCRGKFLRQKTNLHHDKNDKDQIDGLTLFTFHFMLSWTVKRGSGKAQVN